MRTRNNSLAVLHKKNYVIDQQSQQINRQSQEINRLRYYMETALAGCQLANNVATQLLKERDERTAS